MPPSSRSSASIGILTRARSANVAPGMSSVPYFGFASMSAKPRGASAPFIRSKRASLAEASAFPLTIPSTS